MQKKRFSHACFLLTLTDNNSKIKQYALIEKKHALFFGKGLI